MIKIALICSAGISANRILDNINDVVVKNNYDMQFFVITPEKLDNNYNIILLAPQVEYLSTKVLAIAKNRKVGVLSSELYINNDSKGIIDFVNMLWFQIFC